MKGLIFIKLEIRADGAHIVGYVNVPGKKSDPVHTRAHGMVIETIEPGTFQRAIDRAHDITLTVDHGERVYASTEAGTLTLYEDSVGLHADALISDAELIQKARVGKIVGWSFGFTAKKDAVTFDGGAYPLRRVSDIDLDHVTIVINKWPLYKATSWELRDGCSAEKSNMLYRQRAEMAEYRRRLINVKWHE